jgi:hypothetical protein
MKATIEKILPPKSAKSPYWLKFTDDDRLFGLFDKDEASFLEEGMEVEVEFKMSKRNGKNWFTITKIQKAGADPEPEPEFDEVEVDAETLRIMKSVALKAAAELGLKDTLKVIAAAEEFLAWLRE